MRTEEEIRERLDALRKRYYDATHHCYAWRLGPRGEAFRANDDGEPSGTAGKPILGQLLSNDITDCLVVVVRYFGGTKLGVPGLIAAYRESAAEAIAAAEIVELTVDRTVRVDFPLCGDERHHAGRQGAAAAHRGADLRQPLYDAARDPRKPRSGAYRKIAQSRRLGSGRSGMKYEQRIGIFAGQLRF